MSKELLYSVELSQSQIEGLISALDSVVKTNGLTVAEKCSEIYNALLNAQPKVEASAPVTAPVVAPAQVEEVLEEVSLSEVEDELQQIMEVPKKRKRTTRKKK
tara:strand:- start:143 stop:451 length:309 start_codon:yes stop_codon:yes gene_type:complete